MEHRTTGPRFTYFAFGRGAELRVRSSRSVPYENLALALKTAQMLLPLLGALGAASGVLKRHQSALPPVLSKPESPVQTQASMEQWEALPDGSWLSRQWQLIKAAVKAWVDDYAPSMGAALSYYTLFSLAPLLIIVIAVAGMVFGQEAAQGEIVAQLEGIMGAEGAVAVEGMLKAAREAVEGIFGGCHGCA